MALHPESINLISLCTGGGGLDLGIELAIPSDRSVVLVEGEAWSVATLVSAMEGGLMAPAPVWSDVRTFDGKPWRGLVDGLIGGIRRCSSACSDDEAAMTHRRNEFFS